MLLTYRFHQIALDSLVIRCQEPRYYALIYEASFSMMDSKGQGGSSMEKQLLTIPEAAEAVGIGRSKVTSCCLAKRSSR
jgi:hypothetical protein